VSVIDDVRRDVSEARRLRAPWWALLCTGVAGVFGIWLFDTFKRPDLEMPVMSSVVIFGFVLALKRSRWRHVWFWATMAAIAALQASVILLVPWTTAWVPALVKACVGSVEVFLILWVLAYVERLMAEGRN
jgi:hypothetical protein